jgi:hypothetical protein
MQLRVLRLLRPIGAAFALASLWGAPVHAGVLPEDRADVLYHRYEGGGLTVEGPSVLVRKKFLDKFAVTANYYVDMISSASIDVVTQASPYKEKRTQKSVGAEYLRGKTTYSAGYIDSKENDYAARTAYANVSQDMFGDLTTVSFGFKRGWNDIYRTVKDAKTLISARDPTFHQANNTRSYSLGVTQILTRNLIGTFDFETDTDEGYLNSPYRSIRYLFAGTLGTPTAVLGRDPQKYPNTRTSNAAALGAKYYLPYRAAISGNYRFFHDTWGITASTVQLDYTQPLWRRWVLEGHYRFYKQNHADFYRDVFDRRNEFNFYTRDKELSTYQANTIGFGVSYEFTVPRVRFVSKATANLRLDHMMVNYKDFRDERASLPAFGGTYAPGAEPLYKLNANIVQLFFSAWF